MREGGGERYVEGEREKEYKECRGRERKTVKSER
jgi:hypothetical protein